MKAAYKNLLLSVFLMLIKQQNTALMKMNLLLIYTLNNKDLFEDEKTKNA